MNDRKKAIRSARAKPSAGTVAGEIPSVAVSTRTKTARPAHGRAVAALKRCDGRLAEVIARVGPYRPAVRDEGFPSLVRAIVSQQVSKYAAEAVLGRLHALFEDG